ncbi:MAG: hypothetical protein LBO74_04755 [Candidatus Symbiothrix sp.]|jgi:hypothetical protein|nr:hypothetical protein [Candidatus Symbiothrix sp.]
MKNLVKLQDKYDDVLTAIDKLQIPIGDAKWRLEFDTNQLFGKSEFPLAKYQNAEYIEVSFAKKS